MKKLLTSEDIFKLYSSRDDQVLFAFKENKKDFRNSIVTGIDKSLESLGFFSNKETINELIGYYSDKNSFSALYGDEYFKENLLDGLSVDLTEIGSKVNFMFPIENKKGNRWIKVEATKVKDDTVAGFITDITEFGRSLNDANESSHVDNLSGLFNRKALGEHVEREFGEDKIYVYLDINNFKTYNDTHGHDFGDEVIIKFSNSLLEISDDNVKVYRIGGDEFFIISDVCNIDDMRQRLDLLKQMLTNVSIQDKTINIEFSDGIVIDDDTSDYESFAQVIDAADNKMYQTKISKKKHNSNNLTNLRNRRSRVAQR